MNTQSSLAVQLSNKEYRDAFVASQLRIGLPMQCRALRESRELTQPQLAEKAGMSQPRISEIERPGERKLNLETLLRLASAFDVALQVRFVTFSRLVDDDDYLNLDNFYVEPFPEDLAHLKKVEEQMKSVRAMKKPSQLTNALRVGVQDERVTVTEVNSSSEKEMSEGIEGMFHTKVGVSDESFRCLAS